MSHVPTTVVILRPLDELGPGAPRRARGVRARGAEDAPASGRRGVVEILDQALGILRENFVRMVGLGALAWLPVRALQPFLGAHAWEGARGNISLLGPSLSTLVNVAAAALAQCFASAMLARLVYAQLEGGSPRLGEMLRAVLGRLHIVIGIAIVTALATSAGVCACVLPGFLLDWKLAVAPMACVVEGHGLGASLGRSFVLTRRSWWRWVFLALAAWLIGLPFTGIAASIDYPAVRAQALAWTGLSGAGFDATFVLVSSLLLGVAIALRASVLTVYYADCRVRREGSDLAAQQARLRGAEARP